MARHLSIIGAPIVEQFFRHRSQIELRRSCFHRPRIRINAQFRVEFYDLFNRTHLAPPSGGVGSGFGITADTIGDYNGAPGIGPGEVFNAQLGLKITF